MQTNDIITARLASRAIIAGEQDIAVTIRMPDAAAHARPEVALAIVIDRSGSMEGAPLANAKAAATALLDKLDERDAFSVVTYSSEAEVVVGMSHATRAAKAEARAAIAKIWNDGNTCISCGIERAADQLASAPIERGVRRMVLISDGQANTGVANREELAELATNTAARGISISAVGVGLDFDEVTMMRLATAGHGAYYFVEDTARLSDLFDSELAGLGETVATDVRLVIEGTQIDDAYGYPLLRQGDVLSIPIADLRAGETRKVVLHGTITSANVGRFTVHWRKPRDGSFASATTGLMTTITRDPAQVAASVDREAATMIEEARSARVLEQAAVVYEQQGSQAAQRVIERNLRDVHANGNLDAPAVQAIEQASHSAIDNFEKAPPAKAMKATRADAYQLAR